MQGKYAVIDMRNMDFLKNEEGNMTLFDTESEAALACGIYECEDVWVVKLMYNHVEGSMTTMVDRLLAMDAFLDKLNNFKEAIENPVLQDPLEKPVEFHIFRTVVANDEHTEEYKEKHKREILSAIVYSQYQVVRNHLYRSYTMAGFAQQKGRLPNENDRIRVIRGKDYFTQVNQSFLSSIAFEII